MNPRKKVIIVGGGTAGLVIHNELRDHFDVLIIDKSKYMKIPWRFKIPLSVGLLFSGNKPYISKSNFSTFNKRLIPFFNSECLGGASVINGSVHVIGSSCTWKNIFDRFKVDYCSFHSLYSALFTKIGERGKINLQLQSPDELDEAFSQTLSSLEVSRGDSEYFDKPSSGPVWNTVNTLFRSSVLDLSSNSSRRSYLSSLVDDIEIVDGVAKGVKIGKELVCADIIILSAGVQGTGKLLCNILDKINIKPPLCNLLTGIKDHTNLRVNVKCNRNIFSLNRLSLSFPRNLSFVLNFAMNCLSILRGSGATSAANIDLFGDSRINLRINLLRFHESGRLGSNGKLFDTSDPGFSLSLTQINPLSYGSIDSDGHIDPGYFSDYDDIKFMKDALAYAVNLLQSSPLNEYVDQILDIDTIHNDPERYILENFYSGYHLIGGSSPLIDSNFNVSNISNLYVCDATVFETYPSSNIHSSVVIMAKLFSNKLIEKFL